jgi:hypothetical protein
VRLCVCASVRLCVCASVRLCVCVWLCLWLWLCVDVRDVMHAFLRKDTRMWRIMYAYT